MNIEAVRDLVPPIIRRYLYGLWVLAALIVGAVGAWIGEPVAALDAAERVLQYLMAPLGLLAAVNTPTSQGNLATLSATMANEPSGRHTRKEG